jgi:hypothetical protein
MPGRDVFGRCSVMDETRGRLEVPVQNQGIEVGSVGPHDSTQLIIDLHLSKVAGIRQRLEDGAMQLPSEIDVACAAIAEPKPELVVTKHVYRGDANELHASILRQRVDGLWRAPVLCSLPVCFQLLPVQARPLGHELERATRKTADQHLIAADHDCRVMLGVFGVEVGRVVVVEVHRDDDSVEEADAGHGAIMSVAADGEWAGASTSTERLGGNSEADPDSMARRIRANGLRVTNRAHFSQASDETHRFEAGCVGSCVPDRWPVGSA